MRLNFLYRFVKKHLTLDQKLKSDDNVNMALLCGNSSSVPNDIEYGIRDHALGLDTGYANDIEYGITHSLISPCNQT